MKHTQRAIPALLVGLAVFGSAGAAYAAFTPHTLPTDVLATFTADQQDAIEKAQAIRDEAHTKAQAVLEAAGVSKDALHDAMKAHREKQHEAMNAALDANDYAAFKALVADGPMGDKLTEDIFAKLVKIHALQKSGDKEGAHELRKELHDAGFGFGGPGGPRGPGMRDN